MDVHKAGGGIGFTVRKTRESSIEDLMELLRGRMDRMQRLGTTLIEAKSGYGLDVDTEMKMLKVCFRI
jgi:imidazolonepropionase